MLRISNTSLLVYCSYRFSAIKQGGRTQIYHTITWGFFLLFFFLQDLINSREEFFQYITSQIYVQYPCSNECFTNVLQAPEWTEEDLSQLTRSMVKFPGGTPGRWEKIAHELCRSVADVSSLRFAL